MRPPPSLGPSRPLGGQPRPQQREPLPDVEIGAPHQPRQQHPNFTTSNNEFGSQQPQRLVTEEYRYHPRTHTFTNQFGGGSYRSFGLSTAKDEVRVHRVEFFSTP